MLLLWKGVTWCVICPQPYGFFCREKSLLPLKQSAIDTHESCHPQLSVTSENTVWARGNKVHLCHREHVNLIDHQFVLEQQAKDAFSHLCSHHAFVHCCTRTATYLHTPSLDPLPSCSWSWKEGMALESYTTTSVLCLGCPSGTTADILAVPWLNYLWVLKNKGRQRNPALCRAGTLQTGDTFLGSSAPRSDLGTWL